MATNREQADKALKQMVGGVQDRLDQAKAKKAQVIEPVGARGNASDELEIEEDCPDKVEPEEKLPNPEDLNLTARERLERQLSTLMAQVNQSVQDYSNALRDALDVLEMARTTVYTHPMGEVSVTLHEAARRLSELEPEHSRRTNALGNLAMEIRQSEQAREVSK